MNASSLSSTEMLSISGSIYDWLLHCVVGSSAFAADDVTREKEETVMIYLTAANESIICACVNDRFEKLGKRVCVFRKPCAGNCSAPSENRNAIHEESVV